MEPLYELNDLGQPVGLLVPRWRAPARPVGAGQAGTHVRLERLNARLHGPSLHAAARADRSGESWTYMAYGPFANEADHLSWIESVAEATDPLFLAIVNPQGQALGHASFMRIVPRHGVLEIGHVYFSPALQRTAAATEALMLMLSEAFSLGYRRVEWKCNALNTTSRRAAERLGFRFEGVFRSSMVVKGRNRDTAWFAMLDHEWPRVQAAMQAWLAPDNFDERGRQRKALSALRAPATPAPPRTTP